MFIFGNSSGILVMTGPVDIKTQARVSVQKKILSKRVSDTIIEVIVV
jgi:hypothetical protein